MRHRFTRWTQGLGLRRAVQLKQNADKACEQQEYETARALYEASLERFQQKQHWPGMLWVRLGLGYMAYRMQDYPTARAHYAQ